MIAKNNDDINLELQWVPFHNVYVCGFLFLSLLFVAFNRNILTQWQRNGLKWIGSMANYLCANQFCACYDSTNHILFISKWLIAVRMKNVYIWRTYLNGSPPHELLIWTVPCSTTKYRTTNKKTTKHIHISIDQLRATTTSQQYW